MAFIRANMELVDFISNRSILECHSISSQCSCFICKNVGNLSKLLIECSVSSHCALIFALTEHKFIKVDEVALSQLDYFHANNERNRDNWTIVDEEHHKIFDEVFTWRVVVSPTKISHIPKQSGLFTNREDSHHHTKNDLADKNANQKHVESFLADICEFIISLEHWPV